MAIAAVAGQAGGATFDATTSVTKAFAGNVTAGSLITVVCWKITVGGSDAFVAGDCTKSAGTATVGAITLDVSIEFDHGSTDRIAVGIWSCLVTGTGSCTMQVGGMAAGSYGGIGTDEYTGTWDASRVEATNTGSNATDNVSPQLTGTATSAGEALFMGGLCIPGSSNPMQITPEAAFTQIYEEDDNATHQAGSAIRRIVASGTTDAAEWTATTNLGWCCAVVVYKEAAAGGGYVVPRFYGDLDGLGRAFLSNRI